ncbi:MAG: hypothetical protein NUW37_01990 [Planctomycetes bacterium]|nr:hypothetical protein [Planctomycetota bacterium]
MIELGALFRTIAGKKVSWIDSEKTAGSGNRYSFLSWEPLWSLGADENGIAIRPGGNPSKGRLLTNLGSPFEALRYAESLLPKIESTPAAFPFPSGLAGYITCESVFRRYDTGKQSKRKDDILSELLAVTREVKDLPLRKSAAADELYFSCYDRVVAIDHEEKTARLLTIGATSKEAEEIGGELWDEILENMEADDGKPRVFSAGEFHLADSDETLQQTFDILRRAIDTGELSNCNVCLKFRASFEGDAATLFLALRDALPEHERAYFETLSGTLMTFGNRRLYIPATLVSSEFTIEDVLHDALPISGSIGEPREAALSRLAEAGNLARSALGGAVGYLSVIGTNYFKIPEIVVQVSEDEIDIFVGVELSRDFTSKDIKSQTAKTLSPLLSALPGLSGVVN